MEHVITDASTGETTVVPFTEAEIAAAKLAGKKAELAALKNGYDSDVAILRDAWSSASFTGGVGESERIADIKAELVEVDTQYAIAVAAIRAKYL